MWNRVVHDVSQALCPQLVTQCLNLPFQMWPWLGWAMDVSDTSCEVQLRNWSNLKISHELSLNNCYPALPAVWGCSSLPSI